MLVDVDVTVKSQALESEVSVADVSVLDVSEGIGADVTVFDVDGTGGVSTGMVVVGVGRGATSAGVDSEEVVIVDNGVLDKVVEDRSAVSPSVVVTCPAHCQPWNFLEHFNSYAQHGRTQLNSRSEKTQTVL